MISFPPIFYSGLDAHCTLLGASCRRCNWRLQCHSAGDCSRFVNYTTSRTPVCWHATNSSGQTVSQSETPSRMSPKFCSVHVVTPNVATHTSTMRRSCWRHFDLRRIGDCSPERNPRLRCIVLAPTKRLATRIVSG